MAFLNPEISLSELPQLEQVAFHPINRKYLKLSLLSTTIFWLFLLIVGLSVVSLNETLTSGALISIGLAVWAVLMVSQLILILLGFKKKAYALRQRDILYQTGLIWHKTIAIPFNRIQHCSVQQGPIARYFGLAQLHVFTAGGSGSDLSIPGLSYEDAQQIKDFILQKAALQHESE